MLTIPTARLTLRPLTDTDAPALAALLTDPRVSRGYMVPDFPDEAAVYALAQRLIRLSQGEERLVVGIDLEGTAIGWLNEVHATEEHIELGYVLSPDHWNQGYMTEALSALMDHLFAEGWREVRAGAFESNRASLRVMEKCGMDPLPEVEKIEYRGVRHSCLMWGRKSLCQGNLAAAH